MKALRILILMIAIPVFVSATVADAIDQDGIAPKTLQISSLTDDLDLLCHKTKQSIVLSNPPSMAERCPARPYTIIHVSAFRANLQIPLPLFSRPPPVS
jgi:hypothetical protein